MGQISEIRFNSQITIPKQNLTLKEIRLLLNRY